MPSSSPCATGHLAGHVPADDGGGDSGGRRAVLLTGSVAAGLGALAAAVAVYRRLARP